MIDLAQTIIICATALGAIWLLRGLSVEFEPLKKEDEKN
jgi:hypothetical protein